MVTGHLSGAGERDVTSHMGYRQPNTGHHSSQLCFSLLILSSKTVKLRLVTLVPGPETVRMAEI